MTPQQPIEIFIQTSKLFTRRELKNPSRTRSEIMKDRDSAVAILDKDFLRLAQLEALFFDPQRAIDIYNWAIQKNPDEQVFWLGYFESLIRLEDAETLARKIEEMVDNSDLQFSSNLLVKVISITLKKRFSHCDNSSLKERAPPTEMLNDFWVRSASSPQLFEKTVVQHLSESKYRHNEIYLGLAQFWMIKKAWSNAIKCGLKCLADVSNISKDVMAILASAFRKNADFVNCENVCNQCILYFPDKDKFRLELLYLFLETDNLEAIPQVYSKIKNQIGTYGVCNAMGVYFSKINKAEYALKFFEQAAKNKQTHEVFMNLGRTMIDLGESEAAKRFFKKAHEVKPNDFRFVQGFNMVSDFSDEPELRKLITQRYLKKLNDQEHASICFALASYHDSRNDIDEAFELYSQGNSLVRQMIDARYDHQGSLKRIDNLLDFEAENGPLAQRNAIVGSNRIFIVGMPRSGTTLTESILSAHSKVMALGESRAISRIFGEFHPPATAGLLDALANCAENYAKITGSSDLAQFTVDKMPQNFLFTNLIAKAFPNAKIIHILRDPVAVCWSNFKTNFSSPAGLGFAFDLRDLAEYFNKYRCVTEVIDRKYRKQVYRLSYENLVTNPSAEIPKLLDFCGLPFEINCLRPETAARGVTTASAIQVRKPIYTGSSQDWLRYKHHLTTLISDLNGGDNPAP